MKKAIFFIGALLCIFFTFSFTKDNRKILYASLLKSHFDTNSINKKAIKTSMLSVPQPVNGFVPLLRYYNASAGKHFLTTDPNELGNGGNGWVYEKTLGWLIKGTNVTGNVYRFYSSSAGGHYYSLNSTPPSGYVLEGVIGTVQYSPRSLQLQAISEYYSASEHDYCYTLPDLAGENLSSYKLDGVAFNDAINHD